MSDAVDRARAPRWLPWLCLGLLALPFHPLWVDFEQVRRGLLLLLTGTALLALPRLPHVRGERFALIFVGGLIGCAIVQAAMQAAYHDDNTPWSFQTWEAAYRIAHWLGLLVLVRIGAMLDPAALVAPLSTTVLLTSTFGLLQHLGLAEIGGYGVEREPVSTLGNLNVASEWTAVAGIAMAVLANKATGKIRWLAVAALLTACAYLTINPSRSGKVAMLAGLVLLAVMRRKQREFLPLALAAGGAVLGIALTAIAERPQLDAVAMSKELERGTVTLDIRFEIADAATKLWGESPIFGKGPGQFAVEYPRFRSQREIEASSFERQFTTEVRTAHDDWLELLIDGGLVALVLFAAMLFALQRGSRDKTRLVPIFVLLLLMLVRAPLGNAPAAAVAFLLIGSRVDVATRSVLWRRLGLAGTVVTGIVLLVLGALPVAGNTAFAPYVRAKRDSTRPPIEAASSASSWMPYEPRWLQIEAREQLNRGDLQQAAHLAARAIALRPFSPPLLLLLAEVLAKGSQYGAAIQVADQGLTLDPQNPELRALKSTALAELGDVERAIAAVVIDPHPLLRAGLENHFADLALRAGQRGEPKQALRYAIEQSFVGLCDRLGSQAPENLTAIRTLNKDLSKRIKLAERKDVDARFFVTGAIEALDLSPELAKSFALEAAKQRARLTDWQAALLGDQLDRLRQIEEWQPLLPAAIAN